VETQRPATWTTWMMWWHGDMVMACTISQGQTLPRAPRWKGSGGGSPFVVTLAKRGASDLKAALEVQGTQGAREMKTSLQGECRNGAGSGARTPGTERLPLGPGPG
jgi:hypothetical protein